MKRDEVYEIEPEEYCSRVLARVCEAALRHNKGSRGMMINYAQLPEAVLTHILDFFGVEITDSKKEALLTVARLDAKNPSFAFERGSKRNGTEAIRAAVARWLLPVYEQLEATRIGT